MPLLLPPTPQDRALHITRLREALVPVTQSIHSQRAAHAKANRHALYKTPAHKAWRTTILANANHTCALCGARATIADHHPHTLAQLLTARANPWPPQGGRALCHPCSGHTDGRHA